MTTLSLMPFYYAIAGAGGSTPVFVGASTFTSSTTSVVVNITTGIPQAAIVFILVGAGPTAGSQQPTSVSDGINTYTKAVNSGTTTSMGTSLWYTSTQLSTSIVSNQSFSALWGSFIPTQGFISVAYSPVLLSSSLDKIQGNGNVSGTTVTTTSTPLTQASELVLGASFIKSTSTSIITTSVGYSTIDSNNTGFGTSSCSYDWGYIITSTTSSIGYTPTFSTSVTAGTTILATFK